MQPASTPFEGASPIPAAIPSRSKMPLDILIGIVLTCLGVGFTGFLIAVGFFGLRAADGLAGLTAFFQTQYALGAAQAVVLNAGLFLLLIGILRILPRSGPWSLLGPVLILIGGIATASADVARFLAAPFMFPGFFIQSPPDYVLGLANGANGASFVGAVAISVGMLLSLVAVARGALRRRGSPQPSAPTQPG